MSARRPRTSSFRRATEVGVGVEARRVRPTELLSMPVTSTRCATYEGRLTGGCTLGRLGLTTTRPSTPSLAATFCSTSVCSTTSSKTETSGRRCTLFAVRSSVAGSTTTSTSSFHDARTSAGSRRTGFAVRPFVGLR